jgi:ADP-heptose:LPS heptosyltransferase
MTTGHDGTAMTKLLLRNLQAPGDVVVLTAAVRDLHHANPGAFLTAVDTAFPELWENNPHVVCPEALGEPDRVIDCTYPLVAESNRRPFHFIHGFAQELERELNVRVPVGPFRGDIHLSDPERRLPSPAEAALKAAGHDGGYWVVVAGGKFDYTAKWWDPAAYQAVVDHFAGRIPFVQCGAAGDWHVPLRDVVSLVGRTSLRELIRVIYAADGVLCPVTLAMHLAAAVPPRPGGPRLRPCVVVAGGREPAHWEAYPGHQFLHTVGALDCCAAGGCWKSRCIPLGDGRPIDADLCLRPVPAGDVQIGRCMQMITPRSVCRAVETYYEGGALRYPERTAGGPRHAPAPSRAATSDATGVGVTVGVGTYAEMARLAAREITARTGLRTFVLGDAEMEASGLEEPDFLKFRLFDFVEADNIFLFDADIVCLEPWDPRACFGRREVTCVRDRLIPGIRREAFLWGVPPEQYFNAGFFIVNRQYHLPWLRRAEAIRHRHPTPWAAQTPLNAARHELGIPVHFLDRRFNWLGWGDTRLSHDMPVVMAHKLGTHRLDLNVAYLKGSYCLGEPRIAFNQHAAARVAGKTFLLDEQGTRRPLQLRPDGTVLPIPQPPREEDYWFVHDVNGRPRLALASETRIVREFVEAFGGTWIDVESLRRDGAGARLVEPTPADDRPVSASNARDLADEFVARIPPFPEGRFSGRGVVICGGGLAYFPSAWVCIRLLRHLGCTLPIELWQTTFSEMTDEWRALVEAQGVRCVDAGEVRLRHPARTMGGWQLKPYSLLHCAFEQALLLDADNVPVRDPSYLFDWPGFRQTGAVFWPDEARFPPDDPIWRICGVPYRDEPQFESGQVVLDKRRSWRALQLTTHLNDHSDFYYGHLYGDKDTFHMAWRMLGQEYEMVPHPMRLLPFTMCQHDFDGNLLFQHRFRAKWRLGRTNRRIKGFRLEKVCRAALAELARHTGSHAADAPAAAAAP